MPKGLHGMVSIFEDDFEYVGVRFQGDLRRSEPGLLLQAAGGVDRERLRRGRRPRRQASGPVAAHRPGPGRPRVGRRVAGGFRLHDLAERRVGAEVRCQRLGRGVHDALLRGRDGLGRLDASL